MLTLLAGNQEENPDCKKFSDDVPPWLFFEARCKCFAHSPADIIASVPPDHLLLH